MEDVHRALAQALDRITALEGRLERMFRKGTVTDVDGDKQRIRMQIGGTDDEPHLSPMVPHTQIAGTRKNRSLPSKRQQMMLVSPDGDFEQAFAIPLTFSNENQSPSTDTSSHVDQYGDKFKETTDDQTCSRTIDCVDFVINASGKIILNGTYYLGSADANRPLALKDSVDSAGDTEISNLSTKGYAT